MAHAIAPNIILANIPNPAYLVVGSCPSEERKGRTYYDNPAYYLYDMSDIPAESTVDKSRYIQGDFSKFPINFQLAKVFKEKFDVVILDNAVGKFLDGNVFPLDCMFSMVKKGGTFIIDTINGLSGVSPNPGETMMAAITRVKEEFIAKLRTEVKNQAGLEITTFGDLITKNPVANQVYGSLLANPTLVAQRYIRPEGECVVIKKAASGGRRRRQGAKKSRGHKLRSRRRTRRKT
jgi:hypothetical protein